MLQMLQMLHAACCTSNWLAAVMNVSMMDSPLRRKPLAALRALRPKWLLGCCRSEASTLQRMLHEWGLRRMSACDPREAR
eukprot:4593886-Alexandrium_andersonii.AAC.1